MRQNKIFDDKRIESSTVYVYEHTEQSHVYTSAWRMQKNYVHTLTEFKHDFFVRAWWSRDDRGLPELISDGARSMIVLLVEMISQDDIPGVWVVARCSCILFVWQALI